MKRILITGADSYIGTSFEKWLAQERFQGQYQVDTLDMRSAGWKSYDMSGYDSVFHVAGIAHSDFGQASEETIQMYYKVNTELALETAQQAKAAGVTQFILMSSMIVYGGLEHVTKDTKPRPANFYGNSKWQADQAVRAIESGRFRTVVLRPPMIYGKGSRGNYPLLAKLAQKLPAFPAVQNRRSVLYIDHLCEFVRLMVQNEESGIFFPQNEQWVDTGRLVQQIAAEHGHGIWVTRLLAPFAAAGKHMPGRIGSMCRKAFGSSYYDLEMGRYKENYHTCTFEESIRHTER